MICDVIVEVMFMTFNDAYNQAKNRGFVLAYDIIKPQPIYTKLYGIPDTGKMYYTSLQLLPDNSLDRGKKKYLESGFLRPHPLFDEIQKYSYVYEFTNQKGETYTLEVPNAEMFKIPFLGRFLQLTQYMYYVYNIKLTITDTVRSYENQRSLSSGIVVGVSTSAHNFGLAIDVNMIVNGTQFTARDYALHFLWVLFQTEQNSFGFFSGYDFGTGVTINPDNFNSQIQEVISGYNLTFDVVHLQHCGVKDGVLYHGNRKIITEYIDTLQDMILMKLGLLTSEDMKDKKKVQSIRKTYQQTTDKYLFQLLLYFTKFNINEEFQLTDGTVKRTVLDSILTDILSPKNTTLVELKQTITSKMQSLYEMSNISSSKFNPCTLYTLHNRKQVQKFQDNTKSTSVTIQWKYQNIDKFVSSLKSPASFLSQNYINNLFLNTSTYQNQNIITHEDAYKFTFDKTQFWNTWTDYSIKSIPTVVKTYSNSQYVSSSNTTSTSNSTTTSDSTSTFVQNTTINININTINMSTRQTSINVNFTSINTFTRLVNSIDKT